MIKMQKHETSKARAQKEEIEMSTKLKERLNVNSLFGMIKNVEVLYQRIAKKLSVEASVVSVVSPTPYEISEPCKAHQLEVERKRSQASAHAHAFRAR